MEKDLDQDSGAGDLSSGVSLSAQPQKRTRVLLSCAPCRFSKLKCDRKQPCRQCEKKGRIDLCVYAPKPERKRPAAKGMSARLKRLEGMVRGMMEDQEIQEPQGYLFSPTTAPHVTGQVVRGDQTTTYVGATHCLAMLEDIEDIKAYFDDADDVEEDGSLPDEPECLELPFSSREAMNREDLLAQLPEKHVADRLITRYFGAKSPAQHVLHRPTFMKEYIQFWKNPDVVPYHWIAQLFMALTMGIFFNNFSAPHEVQMDSPIPVNNRIKQYRACAGRALILGKYSQPTMLTLPALILYVEVDFLLNRTAQMNCYIMSGICIRVLLKMGLHRDPSKLANISPFESEMRRRLWNMAFQVDLIVSFHMGLPSAIQGIETDTELPQNLEDDDFGPGTVHLPPARPDTEFTLMTYPIQKTKILEVFAKIAKQANSLTVPKYSEVMELDRLLNETWSAVPPFMYVKPLEESIGDSPQQIIQRFGIASLYNKCRCVLHRRYLVEPIPNPEHDYSRKQCLQAAITLLGFQYITWEGCKPGKLLGSSGWFTTSLAVHDFTISAMILYLVIQNKNYADDGTGFDQSKQERGAPTKDELKNMIKKSYLISSEVFNNVSDVRKTANTLAILLEKLGCPVESTNNTSNDLQYEMWNHDESGTSADSVSSALLSSGHTISQATDYLSLVGSDESASGSRVTPFPYTHTPHPNMYPGYSEMGSLNESAPIMQSFDPSWMLSTHNVDWRHLDASIAQTITGGSAARIGHLWMQRGPQDDMDLLNAGLWNYPSLGENDPES